MSVSSKDLKTDNNNDPDIDDIVFLFLEATDFNPKTDSLSLLYAEIISSLA